jgi:hypothetical protein
VTTSYGGLDQETASGDGTRHSKKVKFAKQTLFLPTAKSKRNGVGFRFYRMRDKNSQEMEALLFICAFALVVAFS